MERITPPKCLLLMATYNGEKYIEKQISSIFNQSDVDITLSVSDDCSIDNTLKIIKSFDQNKIIILPNGTRYGSASQNFFRLFRDSNFNNYDYISLADQDDIWESNKIKNAISTIQKNQLDGYASNIVAFWKDGSTKLIDKSSQEVKWDFFFGSGGPGCTIVLRNKVAKYIQQELIRKQALSKEIDLHDWLIYAYVRSKNMKWYVDPWPSMKYRQHSSNEFGANFGFKMLIKRWNDARNGWYRKQILAIADFCGLNEALPINLIKKNKYSDRIKLSLMSLQLRKKKNEAIFLSIILLFPGFK
ncbi:dTDP-rhamnosyl transferase RfbG [Desulfosarcina ovata subsp. sediminis]|uniref:dTDP-rhamnosyl transferase RfbG n=1 Tax=Desulfosarcina ovata subsp. sediminis TaxID=885957 RepID=A0A5K7ZKU0_9BACT|nr:glycosyltransferase [Desulfosarcina ovata]BBO80259.1 dTDP-rhamnosyl transferase RfbG [Desulfosarcina ovata subsp. sediminis]